jgi:hypothetical protein
MSISISILRWPVSADRATPARSMFTPGLPIRPEWKLLTIRQRRAMRHMMLAVEALDHPGVLADCQRATRSRALGRAWASAALTASGTSRPATSTSTPTTTIGAS